MLWNKCGNTYTVSFVTVSDTFKIKPDWTFFLFLNACPCLQIKNIIFEYVILIAFLIQASDHCLICYMFKHFIKGCDFNNASYVKMNRVVYGRLI